MLREAIHLLGPLRATGKAVDTFFLSSLLMAFRSSQLGSAAECDGQRISGCPETWTARGPVSIR